MENHTQNSRELALLEHIERDPDITQTSLANLLGVAVGTVNWHIKRLAEKGYLKLQRARRKKLRYIITPDGIALRARLTVDYIEQQFLLYRKTRQRAVERIQEIRRAGYDSVNLIGEGDVADICRLTCLEQNVAVVQDDISPVLKIDGYKVTLQLKERM